MAIIEIIKDPTRRQLRQFGGLFLPAFLGLVAFLVRRSGASWNAPVTLLGVAVVSIATAIIEPRWLRLPFLGLQYVAYPIGFVLSYVLMAVVYFGVVTPVGLLVRTFRGDPLERKFDSEATTYWTSRKGPSSVERYFRPY